VLLGIIKLPQRSSRPISSRRSDEARKPLRRIGRKDNLRFRMIIIVCISIFLIWIKNCRPLSNSKNRDSSQNKHISLLLPNKNNSQMHHRLPKDKKMSIFWNKQWSMPLPLQTKYTRNIASSYKITRGSDSARGKLKQAKILKPEEASIVVVHQSTSMRCHRSRVRNWSCRN